MVTIRRSLISTLRPPDDNSSSAFHPTASGHPLLRLENVLVTPHVAGVDHQSAIDMAVQAAQNIIDLYHGQWPEGSIVNPAIRPGWQW